jgi:alkylation response protein AidB-like acyl-CoA dehydrogenase
MQIRGGRGYETADSLKARGEDPIAVERLMRDCRINTIFEGSSEIMRLFIAREALDPHLKAAGAALNSQLSMGQRIKGALRAGLFYAGWYPRQWLPSAGGLPAGTHPRLAKHLRYVRRTSRLLARRLFHAMVRFGPKLEKQQVLLGRFVDAGTELFAMAATCARANQMLASGPDKDGGEWLQLADYFCREAKLRIAASFRGVGANNDARGYRVTQEFLKRDDHPLTQGLVD